MARIITFILAAMAVFPILLTHQSVKTKIVQREAKLAAEALRKIALPAECKECKTQLVGIASDFIVSAEFAKKALNDVIPHMVNSDGHQEFLNNVELLDNIAHEIQQALYGDSQQLKEKLATSAEKIGDSAAQFEAQFKGVLSQFASTQSSIRGTILIFGIYKLKYRALYFDKTNKELEAEMIATVEKFNDTISLVQNTNVFNVDILQEAFKDLSLITERNVYKTGNWLEVNPTNVEDKEKVEAVYQQLSHLFDRISAVGESRDLAFMKEEFVTIYRTGMSKVYTLAHVNPDTFGCLEFIRSLIFDGIVIGVAYADTIKAFLNL